MTLPKFLEKRIVEQILLFTIGTHVENIFYGREQILQQNLFRGPNILQNMGLWVHILGSKWCVTVLLTWHCQQEMSTLALFGVLFLLLADGAPSLAQGTLFSSTYSLVRMLGVWATNGIMLVATWAVGLCQTGVLELPRTIASLVRCNVRYVRMDRWLVSLNRRCSGETMVQCGRRRKVSTSVLS